MSPNVQFTTKERLVLELLGAQTRPLLGLQIVAKTGGVIARGLVYVVLDSLERGGYVGSRERAPAIYEPTFAREGTVVRREYWVTDRGKAAMIPV